MRSQYEQSQATCARRSLLLAFTVIDGATWVGSLVSSKRYDEHVKKNVECS